MTDVTVSYSPLIDACLRADRIILVVLAELWTSFRSSRIIFLTAVPQLILLLVDILSNFDSIFVKYIGMTWISYYVSVFCVLGLPAVSNKLTVQLNFFFLVFLTVRPKQLFLTSCNENITGNRRTNFKSFSHNYNRKALNS